MFTPWQNREGSSHKISGAAGYYSPFLRKAANVNYSKLINVKLYLNYVLG